MTAFTSLEAADKTATLFINSFHVPVTDWFWATISGKEIWYVFYLAVLVFFFIRLGWRRALLALGMCVLMVICCDQGANLAKRLAERVRPCNDVDMIARGIHVLETGGGFSFFSAHAANTFGFAVCSSTFFRLDRSRPYRRYTAAVYIWAALVSVSRIFVGRHFLGDVIVGVIAGLLIGFAVSRLGVSIARTYLRKS